jgi:hypothetical protein
LSALIPPVPPETGNGVECPLPFLTQARLNQAKDALAWAYKEALAAYEGADGRPDQRLFAPRQEALEALNPGPHGRNDRTALEVVAYYGLLRSHVPTEAEARASADAAAKLAVWGAAQVA